MSHADSRTQEQIDHNFTYHPPGNDGQIKRFTEIRSTGKFFAELINDDCPPSREKSIAITKLEEAVMWANAAIARNG